MKQGFYVDCNGTIWELEVCSWVIYLRYGLYGKYLRLSTQDKKDFKLLISTMEYLGK